LSAVERICSSVKRICSAADKTCSISNTISSLAAKMLSTLEQVSLKGKRVSGERANGSVSSEQQ